MRLIDGGHSVQFEKEVCAVEKLVEDSEDHQWQCVVYCLKAQDPADTAGVGSIVEGRFWIH
jgi:hypothetical protein